MPALNTAAPSAPSPQTTLPRHVPRHVEPGVQLMHAATLGAPARCPSSPQMAAPLIGDGANRVERPARAPPVGLVGDLAGHGRYFIGHHSPQVRRRLAQVDGTMVLWVAKVVRSISF